MSRTCFETASSSLYIESRILKDSFSAWSSSKRVVFVGLTSLGVGRTGRIGTAGSNRRSGFMYCQVSPPSAMVLTTKSQGSQWEGWSRITDFELVDAIVLDVD